MTAGTAAPAGAFSCVSAAWQAHEAELLGYLRHRLADADTASDVLQDVFVKAMRHGQGFCTLDNPRAWLFQVARNTLIDRARASHPHEPLPDGDDEPAAPQDEPPAPVDALATCLERTMAELPAEDADILGACDLAGQTVRDFAENHGLGLPAAKSRLREPRPRAAGCQVAAPSRTPAPAGPADDGVPGELRARRQRCRPRAAVACRLIQVKSAARHG